MLMSLLSHLAYVVLGVVSVEQPCTSYRVMMAFKSSTSTYFSGSAGALYPLLLRLEKSGFVTSKKNYRTKRISRDYLITPKGRKELKRWIEEPQVDRDGAFTIDLLRARVQFLELVEEYSQRKSLETSIQVLTELIYKKTSVLKNDESLNALERISLQGSISVDKTRRDWLKTVKTELKL